MTSAADILVRGAVVLVIGAATIGTVLFMVGETIEHFSK